MARPRVPQLRRIANQLWLQAVVKAARKAAERDGEAFTLTKLAARLLTLGTDADQELGAERDRLQALATIRRTGSDPSRCVRVVQSEDVPDKLGADVIEVSPARQQQGARKSQSRRQKRFFSINAVSRAERLYPDTQRWFQPVLIRVLSLPRLSLEDTRALLAIELAKLGFLRAPLVAHRMAVELYAARKNRETREARIWFDALAPLCTLGSIDAAGALALLLHDARMSFAHEEAVCNTICEALVGTIHKALNRIDAEQEIDDELGKHIHERLLLQRWQDHVDSSEPLFLGIPVALAKWMALRDQHPEMKAISSLPHIPADPESADKTVAALRSALARVAPDSNDPSRPSKTALQKVGIETMSRQADGSGDSNR